MSEEQQPGVVQKAGAPEEDASPDSGPHEAAQAAQADDRPSGGPEEGAAPEEPEAGPEGDEAAPEEAGPAVEELQAQLEQARLRYEQAEATRQQVWDRYLRLQADFDNFRRRTERERAEWQERAEEELIRQLLPVLDNLERALNATQAGGSSEGAGVEALAAGVKMVYDQFREILGKLGLRPVEAVGRPFDPRLHEAVDRVEAPGHEPDSVVEELQRGYLFRSKLIRPSMVRVAQVPEGEGGSSIG